MSNPYLGEIRMFGGNFAPQGWAKCEGQVLNITEYDALYTLLGTTYGGDGNTTFGLPDLRGRLPLHMGQGPGLSNYAIGAKAGSETVTLVTSQLPAHTHGVRAQTGNGTVSTPTGSIWGTNSQSPYAKTEANATMAAQTTSAGGSLPHDNMMPYLAVNFIISLLGVYPNPS